MVEELLPTENKKVGKKNDPNYKNFLTTQCIVLGFILILFFIQGVSAYGGQPHYDLTLDALRDEGVLFDPSQNGGGRVAGYVAENNLMVDIIATTRIDDFFFFF